MNRFVPSAASVATQHAPMAADLALSVASRCFWRIDEQEWSQITEPDTWAAFIATLAAMGANPCAPYMDALRTPPHFHAQHAAVLRRFTGGLPESAVPVESLYAPPDQRLDPNPNATEACWLQQPAVYMRDLIDRLGMVLPPQFADCPDHLALELDLASLLLASGASEQATSYLTERLAWLPRFRKKISQLGDPADLAFHTALTEALIDVAAPRP